MIFFNSLKSTYKEKGNIPLLDGFRGLAALLVLLSHIFNEQFTSFPFVDSFVVFSGHSGVELFFVLSGFLISYPFWNNYYFEHKTYSYRNFYLRRALRVLPLFYLSFLFFLFLSAYINGNLSDHLKIIPFYLFQIHNFSAEINFLNPPSWTIAVELHFYLLLSLFFLWKKNNSLRSSAITLFIILVILFGYKMLACEYVVDPHTYRNLIYANTFARLDQFIAGIFLALLYRSIRTSDALRKNIEQYKFLFLLSGAFLLFILPWAESQIILSGKTYGNYFYLILIPTLTALAWAFVLLSGLCRLKVISNIFSTNILSMLGKLSFSIYLLHLPLFSWIFKPYFIKYFSSNELLCSFLFIPFIIIVSAISYTLIEKPFLRIKSKYS
jgi:peptidoglycan/LPS O-acetylase OafA/YrhL